MPPREHHYYVYILSSRSRSLYIGVTNNLQRRIAEHRKAAAGTYTALYNITRLVYFERFQYIGNTTTREKELKDRARDRKTALIEANNPTWTDLAESW